MQQLSFNCIAIDNDDLLVYLELSSHCEEGFKQLVQLLLVRLPTNVLVHLEDDHDDDHEGDDDYDYLLKCTIGLTVPLETTHTQAQLSTCGRLVSASISIGIDFIIIIVIISIVIVIISSSSSIVIIISSS